MQAKRQTNLTSWDDHLDAKYGKKGEPFREEWERGMNAFKKPVLLCEVRVRLRKNRKKNFNGSAFLWFLLFLPCGSVLKLYLL
jgi:hypothetical protein